MCPEVCFIHLAANFSFAKSYDQNQPTRAHLVLTFIPQDEFPSSNWMLTDLRNCRGSLGVEMLLFVAPLDPTQPFD